MRAWIEISQAANAKTKTNPVNRVPITSRILLVIIFKAL